LAAGGDPMIGRPGMVGRCSAGWLTAHRRDLLSSRRAGVSSEEEKILTVSLQEHEELSNRCAIDLLWAVVTAEPRLAKTGRI
jgi:hypothetical protein